MMDGWGDGGWGWGAWVSVTVMMVSFFAVIAAVLLVLVRFGSRAGDGAAPRAVGGTDDALRLLDERFARGDIDADDYTKRRDLLRSR